MINNKTKFNKNENRTVTHLTDAVQVDVGGDYSTLRIRLKPVKLLAHLDLGTFSVQRPFSNSVCLMQPYAFFATNRTFDRYIYSFGNFLALTEKLFSHFRISVINQEKTNDVYAQHNFVRSWPGFTFNHLLYFKIFTNDVQFGNTFNFLADYKKTQMRVEVSDKKQDKNDSKLSIAKFSLSYKPTFNSIFGINHIHDIMDSSNRTEIGFGYKPHENTQFKCKVDTEKQVSSFMKYSLNDYLSINMSLKGLFNESLYGKTLASAPFSFNMGIKAKF